jgi:predicted RNA binding protein YcfA (HicA-like mRNA interferase family)
VTRHSRLLEQILTGASDANIRFSDLCALLEVLGFELRTRGSHHIFTRDGVIEILNLQPKGGKAKPYQIKQVRSIIVRYKLSSAL